MQRTLHILTVISLLGLGQSDEILTLTGTNIPSSLSLAGNSLPTDASSLYKSYSSVITVSATRDRFASSPTGTSSLTATGSSKSKSDDFTLLVGSNTVGTPNGTTLIGNATGTSTESAAVPTNTRPCNGYPEFCNRKYSNITQIAAHNSPFIRPGNLGSNQELDVTVQLNDGIRMLQFQTHYVNNTIRLCHSSCALLDVGTLEDYLRKVVDWLKANPYDVVSILMGNSNFIRPTNYTRPIEQSGLIDYVYTPPKIPMSLDDWPNLSRLIFSSRRAIVFLDYQANQTEVPYLLDEFSQMWETPFSPTNRDFPCVVDRPPGLNDGDAEKRLYMANNNLNTEVSLAGNKLLVPNTVLLNETNAVSGYGSAGAMSGNCTEKWNRPPNFILVDYYNIGNVNGSIFQVAAKLNNVTYNGRCCGRKASGASFVGSKSGSFTSVLVIVMTTTLLLWV
ncbi:hypothetical protein LOZ56_000852 [Ophidiomyces ophidiicola]|nr:hypothetical protein LOZ59_000921 [Ophidiomyces ophidiicola]KAI1975061.1 hypothetical protein LOZ56_000852 [Ophidiomyces ophidiicola]KAI2037008.1 hypothetical protein LOZ48_000666 [Ophidiomyces ophidiicola]KAI2148689.1 hypothetical protein LOZ27_001613 [Ophidiomyces ophidiicola]KAI2163495.1 hypothetical protein LOZ25_001527 [Ophidiomyces ophidiicola]